MIGQQLSNKMKNINKLKPNVDIKDIEKLRSEKEGLQQRYEIVEQQVKEIEQKEKAKLNDKTSAYQKLNGDEN